MFFEVAYFIIVSIRRMFSPMNLSLRNPTGWHTKRLSALNRVALRKVKRNGVPTAVFSVPKQSIGKWLTNSPSAALKIPN